jgi:hypothetical protein
MRSVARVAGDGRRILDEAIETRGRHDAELLRLRAHTHTDPDARQADISAALALAGRQGAALFELPPPSTTTNSADNPRAPPSSTPPAASPPTTRGRNSRGSKPAFPTIRHESETDPVATL